MIARGPKRRPAFSILASLAFRHCPTVGNRIVVDPGTLAMNFCVTPSTDHDRHFGTVVVAVGEMVFLQQRSFIGIEQEASLLKTTPGTAAIARPRGEMCTLDPRNVVGDVRTSIVVRASTLGEGWIHFRPFEREATPTVARHPIAAVDRVERIVDADGRPRWSPFHRFGHGLTGNAFIASERSSAHGALAPSGRRRFCAPRR